MGVHIQPPFWFKTVWHNGAPALEIHCNSAFCTAPHHGYVTEAAGQELHAKLGTALSALRSLTPSESAALAGEATSGLPDAKTRASGIDSGDSDAGAP